MKPTETDEALLVKLEASFTAAQDGDEFVVVDAECETVATCDDARVANLLARLLNGFWREHEELTVLTAERLEKFGRER